MHNKTYGFKFVIFFLHISGSESATYELQVSPPNSNGSFCPGNIELTCIGRRASIAFNWFINESSVAQYVYDQRHMLPMNVLVSPVNVTIVSAIGSVAIDIVSTLSSNFSHLRGASIRCGRGSILSYSTVVEGNGKLSSLDKKCSLLSNFNASFCLAIIELTCIGGGVPIEMFTYKSSVAEYVFGKSDYFTVIIIDFPVSITIFNATGSFIVDINSTLSSNLNYFRGGLIQCGIGSILSNHIVLESYGKSLSRNNIYLLSQTLTNFSY